jgi:hypothetical protein
MDSNDSESKSEIENYLHTINELAKVRSDHKYTIRYFFLAEKAVQNIFGYTIDLGTYDTRSEAEARIKELVVLTSHTRFYIIESGKWVPLSTDPNLMKVHVGELGKNGIQVLENYQNSKKN